MRSGFFWPASRQVGSIQESTMKLGTRIIATLTVSTFLLVPAIFADDTGKPADVPKTDNSTSSTTASGAPAKRMLAGGKALPARAASSGSAPSGKEGRHSPKSAGRSREHDDTTPKIEPFMGYSYWKGVPDSTKNRLDEMHGGSTSLAYNFNSHFGLVFDFAGFRVDSLELNSPGAGFGTSRTVNTGGNVF